MMTPKRIRRSDHGAVVTIVALLIPVLLVMTAMAVDLGRQRADRRDMQAIADVIALDMSRLADGRTFEQIRDGSGAQPPAAAALAASAARNDIDPGKLEVIWGSWTNGTWQPWDPSALIDPADPQVPNAVSVIARDATRYFFQPGEGRVERSAIAVFGVEPAAGFSVGSFAARVAPPRNSAFNRVLRRYISNDVFLDVLSHQGLATAAIDLRTLRQALGADLQALSTRELLDTEVELRRFLDAALVVLRQDAANAEAADLLEAAINTPAGDADLSLDELRLSLGDLVHAESGHEEAAMEASIDVPTMIRTSAFLSQCQPAEADPDHPDCNGLNVSGTLFDVPGATITLTELKVVESPRYHYGALNTGVRTGQVQLGLDITVAAKDVGTCTPSLLGLNCLVSGILDPVRRVDAVATSHIEIDLVGGKNTITDIACVDPADQELEVRSVTRFLEDTVFMDTTLDFRGYGLLGVPLGSIGSLPLQTTAMVPADRVRFEVPNPDTLGVTVKSTGMQNLHGITRETMTSNGTAVLSTLGSLGINWDLNIAIEQLLGSALTQLNAGLINPLFKHLGVNLLGSDLVAHAIDCDGASVQLVG